MSAHQEPRHQHRSSIGPGSATVTVMDSGSGIYHGQIVTASATCSSSVHVVIGGALALPSSAGSDRLATTPSSWDYTEIEARQSALAKVAVEVWKL